MQIKAQDKARCCDALHFSEAGLGDAKGLGHRWGSSKAVLQQEGHQTPLALLSQAGGVAMVWEQQPEGPEVLLAPTVSALQRSQTPTRPNYFKAEMASASLTCSRTKILQTHRAAGARHGL